MEITYLTKSITSCSNTKRFTGCKWHWAICRESDHRTVGPP